MLDGFADAARMWSPSLVAADPTGGTVWFSDRNALGKITPQGDVTFFGKQPSVAVAGMAVDHQGILYATGVLTGVIYRFHPNGLPAVLAGVEALGYDGFQDGQGGAARMGQLKKLVFDGASHLYFLDTVNLALRKVSLDGVVTTVAGQPGNKASVDGQGPSAGFSDPRDLACMPDGTIVVIDGTRWRRVTPQGLVLSLIHI